MTPPASEGPTTRRVLVILSAVALAALAGMLAFVLVLLQVVSITFQQRSSSCQEFGTPVAAAAPNPGGDIREQQIANAQSVEQGVRAAGGSGQAVYVALVAAVGESDLINVNYGDRAGPDSRGLFQQRTNWGTLSQRMTPAWAAGAFMLGPHQQGSGGLLDLPGWDSLPITIAIHRVQINADPQHYAKYEGRAREIGSQAGVDFSAPGTGPSPTGEAEDVTCAGTSDDMPGIGNGPCPLDGLHAKGRPNPHDCNEALDFMRDQATSGSTAWYRRCGNLVAQAYGWDRSGIDTAFLAGQTAAAAGRLSTDRTRIPRGALLYWDGRATGNDAGHVAIYDGQGHIYSNDVTDPGTVGRVPWTFPETSWYQKFMGWAPPFFPSAA